MIYKFDIYKLLKSLYFSIAPFGTRRYRWSNKLIQKFLINFRPLNTQYRRWLRDVDVLNKQRLGEIRDTIEKMSSPPLFSLVMPVYNPSLKFLAEAIESVQEQYYPHWELCISDDASTTPGVQELIQRYAREDERIRYVFREENGHISASSNSALELAIGEYVVLLDHDDLLPPQALYEVAQVILDHPDCEIIYSDEDKITESGRHFNPYFKPDFDPELLLNHNMVSHLGVYRLATVRKVGGFRLGLEGSQDYDLLLRVLEQIRQDQVHHISQVLYHWRVSSQSVAENINVKPYAITAGERALNEHLVREGVKGRVAYRPDVTAYQVTYDIPEQHPLVEIVLILTTEEMNVDRFRNLLDNTWYEPVRISLFLPANGSESYHEVLNSDSRISVYMSNLMDDYQKALNAIVSRSEADFVCVLDEHFESLTPGWLERLLGQVIQKGVGAVGSKVLGPYGLVHSNGLILQPDGAVSHLFEGKPEYYAGYFGWGQLQRGFSALSGECVLVRRENYLAVGGLSDHLSLSDFVWVDFCLKLKELGLRNIVSPSVRLQLAHSNTKELHSKAVRKYLLEKWGSWFADDPAFNPNLCLKKGGIAINIK